MADTSLDSLEPRLERVTIRLENKLRLLLVAIMIDIGALLVLKTPVDTGFARANWRPSINIQPTSTVSFVDPTGFATIAKISSVAQSFSLGDTGFITNRADYIEKLNKGSSPQADAGYVQRAVDQGFNQAFRRRSFTEGFV